MMDLESPPKQFRFLLSDLGYDDEEYESLFAEGEEIDMVLDDFRMSDDMSAVIAFAHTTDQIMHNWLGDEVYILLEFPLIDGIGSRAVVDYSHVCVSSWIDRATAVASFDDHDVSLMADPTLVPVLL
jgi:hypothetical protein